MPFGFYLFLRAVPLNSNRWYTQKKNYLAWDHSNSTTKSCSQNNHFSPLFSELAQDPLTFSRTEAGFSTPDFLLHHHSVSGPMLTYSPEETHAHLP